uniref:Uncharacterized protein n=1 Tax=Anopheles stephensi TaxID=30069 RepID=A0A182YTF2_ANOST
MFEAKNVPSWCVVAGQLPFTLNKLECFRQASTKASTPAQVLTVNDANQQLGDATTFGALSSFRETKIGFRG